MKNDLLLRTCRSEPVERPPVWMMRQAGRYLPEYRRVREKADFLTMVQTPELAVEVTLQPIELLGVDAAIIFSDILVIPQAMGLTLIMEEGSGPVFPDPVRGARGVEALKDPVPEEDLEYVLDAVRLARRELADRVPLIGFAGAPWTLAAYMFEGAGSKNFSVAKSMLARAPELAHRLLGRLAEAVGRFLVAQVQAGAQVVQIFDSWAGAVGPRDFGEFVLPYLSRATELARSAGVPVIVFAPGAGWALEKIAAQTEADVIGIDWKVEPQEARRRLEARGVALQGNLDPTWLYAPSEEIVRRTEDMLRGFGHRGHIANLGHGILPDTPVEGARAFVETVRAWSWEPR